MSENLRWWLCDIECREERGVGSWAEEEEGSQQKFLQVKSWLSGVTAMSVRPLSWIYCSMLCYDIFIKHTLTLKTVGV